MRSSALGEPQCRVLAGRDGGRRSPIMRSAYGRGVPCIVDRDIPFTSEGGDSSCASVVEAASHGATTVNKGTRPSTSARSDGDEGDMGVAE
jgi:hypothetical protein